MPIFSMTGYARIEDYNEHCSWTWEVRSVNGKGLDVRSRVPSGFEKLEATARDQVKKSLSGFLSWNAHATSRWPSQLRPRESE